MKKILVPVNFTPASRNASEYAAQFAKAFGAEISLLHVYKDIIPATVGPEPWTVTVSKREKQSEEYMDKEVDYLNKKYSIHTEGEALVGFKVSSINKTSKEKGVDLIVMGLKNEKQSKTSGGTTLKTVRKTNTPVLIIPEGVAFSPVKHIVLATDFNQVTDSSCFETLFGIIKTFDASLRVVHVDKKGADIDPADLPGKLELGRILGKVTWTYDKIENDDVEEGILQFVQNHPTDLLVMIGHQQQIPERYLGPIHTRSISSGLTLPLLIIKSN